MRAVRRIFWIALFVAVLVGGWRFAAANPGPVAVDYLVGITPEVTLWAALLLAFAAGAATAGVLASLRVARLQLVARRYRKAVRGLESEVHQLRTLPLSTAGTGESAAEAPGDGPAERALGRGA